MTDYITLGAMLAAICLMSGWIVIAARIHYFVKMVAATVAVMLAIGIWIKSAALIGYPVHEMPSDGSVVLAIEIDKTEIAFWIGGVPPRSYAIPYDQELAKKLIEAQDRAHQLGGVMILHFHAKPGSTYHGRGTNTPFIDNSPPVSIDVVPAIPEK